LNLTANCWKLLQTKAKTKSDNNAAAFTNCVLKTYKHGLLN